MAKSEPRKTCFITIRCTEREKLAVMRAASVDRRTLSSYACKAVIDKAEGDNRDYQAKATGAK